MTPTPERKDKSIFIELSGSSCRNVKRFVHVAVGGRGCLFRIFAALTRIEVRRVPIPPVMFAVGFLVRAVMFFCFAKQLSNRRNVTRPVPFTTRKARCYFLQQPAVAIRIFERNKRRIRSAFRVRSTDHRPKQSIMME